MRDEMDALSEELHAYLNPQTGELITISSEELHAAEAEADIESYCDWENTAIDYLPLPANSRLMNTQS